MGSGEDGLLDVAEIKRLTRKQVGMDALNYYKQAQAKHGFRAFYYRLRRGRKTSGKVET